MGIGFTGFGGTTGGGLTGVRILPPEAAAAREAAVDEHFASVSLLLHMDGSNESTTFEDKSSNGFTVTANGDAQISTITSQTSGASLLNDGTGDFLHVNGNAAFNFGTGDFTVESWWFATSCMDGRGTPRRFRICYVIRF